MPSSLYTPLVIPRTLMKEPAQFNIQDCTNVKDSSPTHLLRAGEGRNVRGANPYILACTYMYVIILYMYVYVHACTL